MSATPLPSPEELRQRLAAERAGLPFLRYRAADGQRIVTMREEKPRLTIGRAEGNDIQLDLDPEASRLHAEVELIGEQWVIADDGLSRNGTFVNGERISGRRVLVDADAIRCGTTVIIFQDPFHPSFETTRPAGSLQVATLTEGQRRVLNALCRPVLVGGSYAAPATNQAVADELFLSISAVKDHMRALFSKLGVEDLPQNQKRLRLVERAVETGLVTRHEQ